MEAIFDVAGTTVGPDQFAVNVSRLAACMLHVAATGVHGHAIIATCLEEGTVAERIAEIELPPSLPACMYETMTVGSPHVGILRAARRFTRRCNVLPCGRR